MAILWAKSALCGVLVIQWLAGLPSTIFGQDTPAADEEFAQAERLFWLDNWARARNPYSNCERRLAKTDPGKALICKFSRLRADAETNLSYFDVSRIIATDLKSETARAHPEARLRGLIVKATADLSIEDPVLSGKEWEQALSLARSLKEPRWEERAQGELGIIAYLRGDTGKAVALNNAAFLAAKGLNDVAGMIRALSLKGVGLLERNAPDQAISYFDQALDLAKVNPNVRFPLMAYMGKSQALDAEGDATGSGLLLKEANEFVDRIGMTVYKADLAIALGVRAEKQGKVAEAEAEFNRACQTAAASHMPRPFADAMFHRIELGQRTGDWFAAEKLVPTALNADRKLIDIQFLPQHLAQAAEIESHIGNVARAREYLSQANDVIDAALARAPSPRIERSLIATMSGVYLAQFQLALHQDHNLEKAFDVVESARSRVIAGHLRAAVGEPAVHNTRTVQLESRIAGIQLSLLSSASSPRDRSKLLRSLDDAEAELQAVQFSQRKAVHATGAIHSSLATVQSALSADELLLEYVVSDKSSFVLAITNRKSRAYNLAGGKEIESLVRGYADEISSSSPLPESARTKAKALYAAVLSPIIEVNNKSRLIVVPDGPLHVVGFDSLVDRQDKYLIRSHTVSFAPSGTVVEILRRRPFNLSAPYTTLAFGAPQLPKEAAAAQTHDAPVTRALLDISGGNMRQLRSAAGEAREISSELGGAAQVFVGASATETRLKAETLTEFRVIHFATHAFADLHHPERSAIVLAPDSATGDDGLLQIREIRNLNLRADLVTLSACDSGIGRAEGIQGVESLVDAFQFAGARSVLATRWVTDDTFSAALMANTYRALATGATVADALRQAKLAALDRFGTAARPSFWSTFFVSGDSNTRIHEQRRQPNRR